MKAWTWENAGPELRGVWIRNHVAPCESLPVLCELFHLTEEGAQRIVDGDKWRPEYERAE